MRKTSCETVRTLVALGCNNGINAREVSYRVTFRSGKSSREALGEVNAREVNYLVKLF